MAMPSLQGDLKASEKLLQNYENAKNYEAGKGRKFLSALDYALSGFGYFASGPLQVFGFITAKDMKKMHQLKAKMLKNQAETAKSGLKSATVNATKSYFREMVKRGIKSIGSKKIDQNKLQISYDFDEQTLPEILKLMYDIHALDVIRSSANGHLKLVPYRQIDRNFGKTEEADQHKYLNGMKTTDRYAPTPVQIDLSDLEKGEELAMKLDTIHRGILFNQHLFQENIVGLYQRAKGNYEAILQDKQSLVA